MKMRAVMFDLDGTLLDTLEDLGNAMNTALRAAGYPQHSTDFYRHAVGDGPRIFATRSLPETAREAVCIDATVTAMRQIYAKSWNVKTRPYEGIVKLVAALRDRGVTLAVLSNKPDSDLQKCVGHFFPEAPFAAVHGVVPDGPIKPDPAAALAIMDTLGISREQWLYVGDTNTDMQTAVAAGLFAVGCTWGFRDRQELLENGAEAIIDRPADLLALCDE
jgi:phosphoglycolate phosphatase